MNLVELTDRWVIPGLLFLADWSIRWGILLAPLLSWLSLCPPRQAGRRHRLCALALTAGLLLPLVPRWAVAPIPWLSPATDSAWAAVPIESRPTGSLPRRSRIAGAAREDPVGTQGDPDGPPVAGPGPPALDQPGGERLGVGRLAILGLAAAWSAIVLILTARLVGGQVWLARLRRSAANVAEASVGLLEDCRRAVRLTRRVNLGSHPAVSSPVTLGGRRPLVLVPPDWEAWPEAHRRASLLHELAHLVRCDDWVKLVQELVRIGFFFHPLVWWLLARLERERELLCDEAVLALGTERLDYARLLLDLARRPGRRLERWSASPLPPGCLTFHDRATVTVRLERLLEDDMSINPPLPVPTFSLRRVVVSTVLAAMAALAAGGFRFGARAESPPAGPTPGPTPAQPTPALPPPRTVSGIVSESKGKPVPEADVVCVIEGKPSRREVLKTDQRGAFSIGIPEGPAGIHLYAYKPGYAPAACQDWIPEEERGKHLSVRLARPEPFSGTVVDREGKPVAGARVRIEQVATNPVVTQGERGGTTMICFEHVRPDDLSATLLEPVYSAMTDRRGRFTFEAAPPGSGLKLGVIAPAKGPMRIVTAGLPGSSSLTNDGMVPREATSRPLVAIPAARITGRVVTRLPGVNVSGLDVRLQGSRPARHESAIGSGETRTDDQGRFWFSGLDEGTANILLGGHASELPWTYRAAQDVEVRAGATAEVTIELIRGVEVVGTVVNRATGQGIEKATVGVYGPYRPRSGAATQGATTDAEGRYHYRLPSGQTYFYVMSHPPGTTSLPDGGSTRTVTIPEDATRFDVPPLEVVTTVGLHGRVVDAQGHARPGITILGVARGDPNFIGMGLKRAGTIADEQGEFRLGGFHGEGIPGQETRVAVRLGDGREIEVPVTPAADGAVIVRLPETARALP